MKVLIAGSRSITDYKAFFTFMLHLAIEHSKIKTVVTGNARGVDSLGNQWAKYYNKELVVFNPDWDTYGNSAGFIRNRQMIDYLDPTQDIVILFWDGKSRGTASTKAMAIKKGLRIYEKIIEGKKVEEKGQESLFGF